MKSRFLAMLTFASLVATASAVEPLWVRDVRISPNGEQVAFTYKGAIYSVPSAGGQATRLTAGTAFDSEPVWSPDGKSIAFASDRNGGTDIYIMNANGSNPRRLTSNSAVETPEAFSPDGKLLYFSATIQDPASSALGPYRANTELYTVPVAGGRINQVLATPAVNIENVPGTDMLVYEGVKGGEDKWRKHHTSSVTRDIWTWSPSKKKFTNVTNRAGEDRDPVPSADGKTLYFLSERDGGSFNVYSMSINGGTAKQITDFTKHPVRFLSRGGDLLCFTYNGEAFTMKPGDKPKKLNINIVDNTDEMEQTLSFNGGREATVSPDGQQVAFTNRGEVFVTSTKYPSTKQITHTAAGEGNLSWGKDGRELYYTSYRTGRPAIYRAKIVRKEDPNFSNATLIEEEPMWKADKVERSHPSVSPDGKKMIFLENRNTLKVRDLKTGSEKVIGPDPIHLSRSGAFSMEWSPDSRWLAIEYTNPLHHPYSDIALVNTEDGELIKVTETGYFDQGPRFTADGKALIFSSERYGMRNHASWGSMNDVMMVFLTKDAYDRYRLSEEDFALLKEVEKEQKKNAAKTDDKGGKKDAKAGKADAAKDTKEPENLVKIDREGLQDRIVRLTPASSNLRDYIVSKDGETLYYLASFESGTDLWSKNLRKGDVQLVKKGVNGNIQTDKDGNIYFAGMQVRKFDPKSKALTPVSTSGNMKLDPAQEREAMLDFVENEARERFLLPKMPVDWEAYVANYRRFLPHINNNHDFAELLSELLGELNVSHSGGRFTAKRATDATASLGLLYDLSAKGDGLKITEVLEGGPFDRATSSVKKGDVITAINGTPIKAGEDWTVLLNNISNKKTLVSFSNPKTGKKWDEVVLPISSGAEGDLLYRRWVKGREAAVDSLSNGRLGYVHLKSMSDDSFREIYAKLLGKYVGKEGIVIDTRWNGGGRLHEDVEVLFSGNKYVTQEIHGRVASEMPSRRWNKPSVMVTGEANYSNAHGTPWVYKNQNLGKIVGAPVPGTMSSVNWITLQDPSLVFGVPVVAFRTNDGVVLENTQLEPDILVLNAPDEVVVGKDAQIEAAVKSLLQDIDAAKKK